MPNYNKVTALEKNLRDLRKENSNLHHKIVQKTSIIKKQAGIIRELDNKLMSRGDSTLKKLFPFWK